MQKPNTTVRYSAAIKTVAYELIQSGEKLTNISKIMGVGISTLSNLKRNGDRGKTSGRMPTFLPNSEPVIEDESEVETYFEIFNNLSLKHQEEAEKLRFRWGLQTAINYAKVVSSPGYYAPISMRQQ